MANDRLAELVEPVRRRFLARHDARELAFGESREVIRSAANAIRALHRDEADLARELLQRSRTALERTLEAVADHPDVLHGGFVQDAAKEYAEARLTAAAFAGERWPGVEDVGVDDASWLHGLAETVGELRRRCLDLIRSERLDEAEEALARMDEVLASLVTIDVPDALTRGLRRSTDGARAITERTRGDLTTALGHRRLREALDAHRATLRDVGAGGGAPGEV